VPVEKRIDERLERRADLELAYPAERDEAKLQGLLADARVACRHADDERDREKPIDVAVVVLDDARWVREDPE
jgi:hypothetical protein